MNILFKRKLESYDSSNPGLSKDDVLEYVDIIKSTIINFDKKYLDKDYKYIKQAVNKYLLKVNGTCLINLKRSFSIKLEKFSSLITAEKMEFLKEKILTQYYLIEPFIHDRADFIDELINNFTEILNNTKEINTNLSEFISEKSSLYYDILESLIESKYRTVEPDEVDLRLTNEAFKLNLRDRFENNMDMLDQHISNVDNYLYDKEHDTKYEFEFAFDFGFESFSFEKNFFNKTEEIGFPLPIPFLYLVVRTTIRLSGGFDKYLVIEKRKGFGIGIFIRGEISAGAEVGFYIPDYKSSIQITLTAGLNGVLASGRIGLRLSLFLNSLEYELDLYYVFNAFSFDFYVKFAIRIRFWKIDMTFQYYIARYIYLFYSTEKHKKKLYDLRPLGTRNNSVLKRIENNLK